MSNYSNLEKILHQQFLGSNPLSDYLYKRILKKATSKKTTIKRKDISLFLVLPDLEQQQS